jgi:flagellar hook-length control protein FliK
MAWTQAASAQPAPDPTTPPTEPIGAIAANGQRAQGPRQPIPSAPATTPPAQTPPEGDASDGVNPAASKSAQAGNSNSANAPATGPQGADFKDFLRGMAEANQNPATPNSANAPSALAAQASSAAPAASSDPAAIRAAAAPVASQVAREIVRRADGDNTRFELRLDPPELGKIQVRLDVSRDHKVTVIVSADNPQALSELSRGARDLQQALQSAGLELPDDGLRFDLNNQQGGFAQPDQGNGANTGANGQARTTAAENQPSADASTAPTRRLSIESWRGSRIDVMA